MSDDRDRILSQFVKAMGQELAKQLYGDARAAVIALSGRVEKTVKRARRKHFKTIPEVVTALKAREIEDGDLISVDCKPSRFGPFLRYHFLPGIVGSSTSMRLGPPIGANHFALAAIGQIMSHLSPAGLYPTLDDGVLQACLYPAETAACGVVSILPLMGNLVPWLPAILAARHAPFLSKPCRVTGVVRLIDGQSLSALGLSEEDREGMRQRSELWFLDATSAASDCSPLAFEQRPELWGGLYASGHLEIARGHLPLTGLVEPILGSMIGAGFKPEVHRNKAGPKEMLICATGCRAVVSTKEPLFSIHMDVDLSNNFDESRRKFDRIVAESLRGVAEECAGESVDLLNPLDLDFSYTDSSRAFSVLTSMAADSVHSPLAMAIRDWHRRRSSITPMPEQKKAVVAGDCSPL